MNKVFIFALGAAAGSLITWRVVVEKYKRIADEEIESVMNYYKNREKEVNESVETPDDIDIDDIDDDMDADVDNDREDYANKVKDLGYNSETEIYMTEPGVDHIEPYVISPDEFGECDGYFTKSWTYYADFVLTDEMGDIVDEPEAVIGDALEHFGEYEEDSVYVRNENTECDYEILKHEKTFSEINGEVD